MEHSNYLLPGNTGSSKTFKHVKMFPMRRSADLYCCSHPPLLTRERILSEKFLLSTLSSLPLSAIFIQVEIMKICRAGSQWHFIGYWARQPSSRIITGGPAVTHGGGYQLLLSIPGRVCSLQSGACIESLGGRGVCSLTTNRQPAVRPQTNICWLE